MSGEKRDNRKFPALKVIVVGESEVGKTSIIARFCDGTFDKHFISTIGIDFKIGNIVVDDENFRLQIWDTAGQERFRTITTAFYRGAQACFVVFDISRLETLETLQYWIDKCREQCISEVPIILVGNKIDLLNTKADYDFQSNINSAQEIANVNSIPLLTTSAKTDTNIEDAFASLVRMIRSQRNLENVKTDAKLLQHSLSDTVTEKWDECCHF